MSEIERLARVLCEAVGDYPDAVGPRDDGVATPDHAFPRWMNYKAPVRVLLEAMLAEPPPMSTPEAFDAWSWALYTILSDA